MTHYTNEETPEQQDTTVFKCPSCGGNMLFNPEANDLKCPFCDTEVAIEHSHSQNIELDYYEALNEKTLHWSDDKRVFRCENCGAETVLNAHTVADFCSFCGSSHVSLSNEEAGIRPSLVLPFAVSQKQAEAKFKEWISKRYMAPKKLMSAHQLDRLTGIYIPYWTYDANTFSQYTVRVGTHYYVPVTRTVTDANGNTRTETQMVQKTRWHVENGTYRDSFDDILIQATHQQSAHLLGKVEPFPLTQLVDYKEAYLSGFIAERYAIALDEGWLRAQRRINDSIAASIQMQVRGDVVVILQVDTDYDDITYKHVLLPIWLSSFSFKGKVYPFIVNGQSGRVAGEAPVSWVKVTLLTVFVIAIIGIIYMVATNNGADIYDFIHLLDF